LKSFGETGKKKERDRFFAHIEENRPKDRALASLSIKDIEQIFDDLLIYASFRFEQPYEGTTEDHANLRTFTSRLINRFINAVKLQEPGDGDPSYVTRDALQEQEIAILKQLTWFYVIEASALEIQHEAQKKIILRLADVFVNEALKTKPSGVLPIFCREALNRAGMTEDDKRRTAIDLIGRMTENQAVDLYQRLEGISVSPGLDRILF
jgi:dGTPase